MTIQQPEQPRPATFAEALRTFLRRDPDRITVELRYDTSREREDDT